MRIGLGAVGAGAVEVGDDFDGVCREIRQPFYGIHVEAVGVWEVAPSEGPDLRDGGDEGRGREEGARGMGWNRAIAQRRGPWPAAAKPPTHPPTSENMPSG